MNVRFGVLAAVAIVAASALAVPATATGSTTIPVPEHDSFYRVPTTVAKYHDGQVIASRMIDAKSFGLSLPVTAWELKYRTEDFRGRPTATVTTVMVPKTKWTGPGSRPLVSYQTAEDGVAGHCSPSYSIRTDPVHGVTSNSYPETAQMDPALLAGWAVAAPDYEGPRSEFLVAGTEARGVLDGIRAVRNFTAAGITRKSPIGLWGYSGGAFASDVAAQLQPSYAPHLKLSAITLGGLVASVPATIAAFSGSVGGGAIPMGINGFLRAYPGLHILSYLNASGRAKVKTESADCIDTAVARYPFLSVKQIVAFPNALQKKPIARMLNKNSPLGRPGIPTAPIYEYHATGDEFAPIAPARKLLRRFCAHGVTVQHVEFPVGEHLSEVATGAPGALQFLASRFAGKTPTNTCTSIPK
jgi:hypothetical protein